MKYNFDEVIDRSSNRSSKYDERVKKFGTADVIPLWVADMDFRTAQPIIDACKAKAEEGIWGYTSRPDSYFQAVQDWEVRRNHWKPDTALMSWSLGVVPALSAIVKLFSNDGDKVLIQTPVYSEFYDVVEAWDRTVVENKMVEENDHWHIDFADFEAKVKECSIFLLCNPHNPLGIVWDPADLRRMAEICIANNTLLVSDEIHSDLIFHRLVLVRAAGVQAQCRNARAGQRVQVLAVAKVLREHTAILAVILAHFRGVIQAHLTGVAIKRYRVAQRAHHLAGDILQNHLRITVGGGQGQGRLRGRLLLGGFQAHQLPALHRDDLLGHAPLGLGQGIAACMGQAQHQPDGHRQNVTGRRHRAAAGEESFQPFHAAPPCISTGA